MKIVIVDTTLAGPLIGGAQAFLPHLAAGLVSRGATVHIVSNGQPHARVAAALRASGATVHTRLWPHLSLPADASPVFARWLNQLNPDAYVISVSPDIGWTVLPLLRAEIATLAIAHTDDPTFYRPINHYREHLARVVGVSHEVCAQIVKQTGVARSQIDWIPYGVMASAAPPAGESEPPLRLAYCARLEATQKRSADVIAIVHELRRRGTNYTLQVIGDGPLFAQFASELWPEIASGRVKLHGWIEGQAVLEVLRRAEVFLLTSAYEGFCIALLEAMANGLAPLITDIPSGNRQLIEHERNGLLAPVGDTGQFVAALERLAQDRQLLFRLRQAAWRTAQPFTLERMVDAYLDCCERAIAQTELEPRQPQPDFPLMESCRSRYPLWLRRLKVVARRATQSALP